MATRGFITGSISPTNVHYVPNQHLPDLQLISLGAGPMSTLTLMLDDAARAALRVALDKADEEAAKE